MKKPSHKKSSSKILITWVGLADFRAKEDKTEGPILGALKKGAYDKVVILNANDEEQGEFFRKWLSHETRTEITINRVKLKNVMDYESIYKAAREQIDNIKTGTPKSEIHVHLSPGTPAMSQCWVLLAAKLDLKMVRTSQQEGYVEVKLPFDVWADFHPDLKQDYLSKFDNKITDLAGAPPSSNADFEYILYKSKAMEAVINRARLIAPRNVPVLLLGETGTGKELFAKAIHEKSARKEKKFVPVNCGAIPSELVESTFFGIKKGAFTGADTDQMGVLEQANGGTLFLDEVGEMPLHTQVKLLRVLQEKEVTRVGDTKSRKIDIRVIAATHKNLFDEVIEGRFREDLMHRLAVAVLQIPPLRKREGDIAFLAGELLEQINEEAKNEMGYVPKKLSVNAIKRLVGFHWQGNVRELMNTLLRASIWTQGETISAQDIDDALLPMRSMLDGVLGRTLGEDFDVNKVISEVAKHYLQRALEESHGVKAQAARLIGLKSATSFTDWTKKHGLKPL